MALIHSQALASVAAANKMTVAEVESKLAAGDAETMKAVDEAKEIERRGFNKWQSAMTYKFVGGLQVLMDEPLVEGVGNTTHDAATSTIEPSNTEDGPLQRPAPP